MQEIGEKTQPAKTYQTVVRVTCDLCGDESLDPSGGIDSQSWDRGCYDVEETAIFYKEGTHYPEGSNYVFIECDICPKCFMTKLVPWLKEQGVTIRERDVDF